MLISDISSPSLHDALPISFAHPANRFWPSLFHSGVLSQLVDASRGLPDAVLQEFADKRIGLTNFISGTATARADELDRKSTRLNSSHVAISYAVFCLKKKT